MAINRREITAIGFVLAGVTLEAFAQISAQGGWLHGVGVVTLFFGIAIELIGLAIYDETDNPPKK